MNKNILFSIVFFVVISFSLFCDGNDSEYVLYKEKLIIGDISLSIYVSPRNIEREIFGDFYVTKEENGKEIVVLQTDTGVLKNRYDEVLIDLEDPSFYGYKLILSYPEDTNFSPGIVVIPYYSENSVGDSYTVEWDKDTQTFKLTIIDIP